MRNDVKDGESLREMFQQARAADAATAPRLDSVLTRRRLRGLARRQWPRGLMPALAASVAGLALAGLLVTFYPSSPPAVEISISEWRSPTAFLLEPPGEVVLYGVPALGRFDTEVFSCDGCF